MFKKHVVLKHHANAALFGSDEDAGAGVIPDLFTETNMARVNWRHAGDAPKQSRLARAVGAEECDHFTRLRGEFDV